MRSLVMSLQSDKLECVQPPKQAICSGWLRPHMMSHLQAPVGAFCTTLAVSLNSICENKHTLFHFFPLLFLFCCTLSQHSPETQICLLRSLCPFPAVQEIDLQF